MVLVLLVLVFARAQSLPIFQWGGVLRVSHAPDHLLLSTGTKGEVPHKVLKPHRGKNIILFNSVSTIRRYFADLDFPMIAFDQM